MAREEALALDVRMIRDRWLYSVIELRPSRGAPVAFGVALFRPDREPMLRLVEVPPSGLRDGARWLMAARAIASRLRAAKPRSLDEIQAFIRLEGNEMELSAPHAVPAQGSAEATLVELYEQLVVGCRPERTMRPLVAHFSIVGSAIELLRGALNAAMVVRSYPDGSLDGASFAKIERDLVANQLTPVAVRRVAKGIQEPKQSEAVLDCANAS